MFFLEFTKLVNYIVHQSFRNCILLVYFRKALHKSLYAINWTDLTIL